MIISNQRISIPKNIQLGEFTVEVVDEYKLLGVIIDSKLTFEKHVTYICRQINIKLFSIKRLFYLCSSVKNQFFKTFILPYFDYCLSLYMYYPKKQIQKLADCFYICLDKLFHYRSTSKLRNLNPNMLNDFLSSHKLFAFEHRIFFRLLTFTNKIVNNIFSPSILKDCLTPRAQRHNTRSLRNSNEFDTPRNKTQFGEMTFSHFFPNLVNLACLSLIHLPIQQFRSNILKDINLIFNKLSVETDRQPEKYNILKKFFIKNPFC